jgi:hypothetical protein
MDTADAELSVIKDRIVVFCIECGEDLKQYEPSSPTEFEQIELDIANIDHDHPDDDPAEAADGSPG